LALRVPRWFAAEKSSSAAWPLIRPGFWRSLLD